ncbi:hypothetical protein AHiyo8_22860 [Arthrobacter sp. Hiyo8]|nr:hypothetical protein AHiyo8_22860 [Arthrobacter sp. Hiyo8]GAP58635.1 hypothetical protein AHiyo1_17370 [Arthrobacter sp. Hiyo1]
MRPGTVSVASMIPHDFRRPLTIVAAVVAVLSLASVAAVMGIAFANGVAPVWVTSTALYGLPLAFILMAALVVDAVWARRRQ